MGDALKWFQCFLSDRSQKVKVLNITSKKMTLSCGVPQGSMLGPSCELQKLQRVQNAAARILTGDCRRCHITPVLKSLHWLPITSRIECKILMLTFKCVKDLAPNYLK